MAEGLGAVQESLLQEITCNICFRLMEDPRSLPCTHVYCNECLKRLVQRPQDTQGCLQCPECRKMIHVPSNDTLDLPKDFRTVRLKEVYDKMLQIGQSTSTSSPTTSTLEKHVEASNTLKCQFHGNPIEMYCISCRDILCQECVQIHENHNYDYLIEKNAMGRNINLTNEQPMAHKSRLDDYSIPLHNTGTKDGDHREKTQEVVLQDVEQYEIQQKQLNAIVTKANEYKSRVATAITEVVKTKAEVDSQARTRHSQVDAAFEEMISLVQSKWQQVNKEIAGEQGEKNDILLQQKDQLSLIFSEIDSILMACSSQTTQEYESTHQRLESLQKAMKTTSLKPAVTADVRIDLTKGDLVETCCKQCILRHQIPDISKCKLTYWRFPYSTRNR